MWSTHGTYLNRETKTAIKCLGANKSQKAIIRTGKAVGILTDTVAKFDNDNKITPESGKHAAASAKKDRSNEDIDATLLL